MGVKIIDLPDLTGLPENGDYVVITDGTVTAKLNYQLLAQAIIEEYASSSLGGQNQALKTVIDSLSTDVTTLNELHTLSYETFEITPEAQQSRHGTTRSRSMGRSLFCVLTLHATPM